MINVLSYGGGTNSAAILVGLYERGERPDHILFADTGGERPETYRHVEFMSEWAVKHGLPEITTVQDVKTLEADCLTRKVLPSVAFGFKSCSDHFKVRPQKRWLKANGISQAKFWVGIDAGEDHRKKYEDTRYPLIEWDWDREACVAAVARHGLPHAGKSACFFCPNSKAHEIVILQIRHPDLMARALEMEANADLTTIKGLGRDWSWKSMLSQQSLFPMTEDELDRLYPVMGGKPCACVDGDEQ